MKNDRKIKILSSKIKNFYSTRNLPFHGWHHINFVVKKSREFAKHIGADTFLVESAALTHDLNYAVKPNSEPEQGEKLRKEFLTKSGFSLEERNRIEMIIVEENTKTRGTNISNEGKALSDADTLFKVLPITPILFSGKYMLENKVDIQQLAKKICDEQNKLMSENIYFYTELAKGKYMKWAKTNLELWNNIQKALEDKDVQEVISIADDFILKGNNRF